MALLPYLVDEMRPRRYQNHFMDLDLFENDFLADMFDRPIVRRRKYLRPWRNLAAVVRDVGSTIKTDKDKFQINLDVQHFAPEEISVKTADGWIIVEGNHEEKKDEHGYISRQFKRRYALPEECSPQTVESKLSSDGVLTITAPRSVESKDERVVPITQTGPVRRKHCDENEEANGDIEETQKSPQKKRKR